MIALAPGHRPTADHVHELRFALNREFPGTTFSFLPADIVGQILNFGLPSPVDIQITGMNVEANRRFAAGLLQEVKQVSGTVDLRIQQPANRQVLNIAVDRTKASQVGITMRDVATNLLTSLSGSFQEIDQQVQQARSTLAVGQANLRLAQETAQRFTELRATRAVSQQDVDNAVGALRANQATVRAEQATLRQLEQLQAFEQVRAPFDGIITVRNIDVGDLINAGASATPGTELFHIVQSDKLRVYVNVPEPSAQATRPGLVADLSFAILPTSRFTGTLVRTANAIEPSTRTLRIEILVDNPAGILFAGAYAQVHLKVPIGRDVFLIPVAALLFRREGLHVATVASGKIVMKAVTPGHDLGDRIEIVQGLTADDAVVMNPPDSITAGEPVQIAPPVRPPY